MTKMTICWDCAKATNNGCSWGKDLVPVEGWTAVKTVKKLLKGESMQSFMVISCPEFERDAWNGGQMRLKEYEERMSRTVKKEKKMGENTKKSVLLECLEYERGLKKLCSKEHNGLMPMQGLEDKFYDQEEKCGILQDLIHALDSEHVRIAIADWQKEIIENGPPKELKIDGGELKN